MDAHHPAASDRPFIGVATTTPVAFVVAGVLYLERMNMLSEEGAGILSPASVQVGERLPLTFRLSTARDAVGCHAEVIAAVPTTPAGLKLRSQVGEKEFVSMARAALEESATSIIRLTEMRRDKDGKVKAEPVRVSPPPPATTETPDTEPALHGFTVRFLDLDANGKAAIAEHIRLSRRIGDALALRNDKLMEIGENERATMEKLLDEEGNLSTRARDW